MRQGWHERCSVHRRFPIHLEKGDWVMLWTILVILLVLWLVGLLTHVGGGLIHLLLVVAAVALVISPVTGRRAVEAYLPPLRGRCWPGLDRLGHQRGTSNRDTDNPKFS